MIKFIIINSYYNIIVIIVTNEFKYVNKISNIQVLEIIKTLMLNEGEGKLIFVKIGYNFFYEELLHY